EARWRCRSKPGVESRCDTTSGSADAQFCSSDNTAAACATARRCSKSKAPLQEPDASEQACGPDGRRKCSLPENAPGCVPIPNQAVESSTFYSGSTPTLNFEIGSRDVAYGSLLRARCQQLNAYIASALEARFPEIADKLPERLAQYCTEGAEIEKAVGYWVEAGRQSVARHAMIE